MMAPLANRREVTDGVWQYLQTHDWTGNVRELEAFARSWAIGINLPDNQAQLAMDGRPLHLTVAEFERTVIENALRAVGVDVLRLERQS